MYLYFSITSRPWESVLPQESNPRPTAEEVSALPNEQTSTAVNYKPQYIPPKDHEPIPMVRMMTLSRSLYLLDFRPEKSCFLCISVGTLGVLAGLRCVLRDRRITYFFFTGRCSSVLGRVASSPVPWSEVLLSPLLSRLWPRTGRPKVSITKVDALKTLLERIKHYLFQHQRLNII